MNFWLIKSNSTEEINTKDPIKRDIVAAGAAGAMIRFRTDKPGMFSSPVKFMLYSLLCLRPVVLPLSHLLALASWSRHGDVSGSR